MARTLRHLLTAFIAGEISPLLSGRVDTQQYQYGLQTCENFVPVNEGPLVKRQGFEFIRDADHSAVWLTAFRRSIAQEYVIEWGDEKARFFTNGGRIETAPNVAYEVAMPYAAADVRALSLQQSFDRLYIDHPSYPPSSLTRTSPTTFTYAESTFTGGPFQDVNTNEAVLVTASAVSGAGITLYSTSAIFRSGHVGSLFRLEAKDFSDVKAWEADATQLAQARHGLRRTHRADRDLHKRPRQQQPVRNRTRRIQRADLHLAHTSPPSSWGSTPSGS